MFLLVAKADVFTFDGKRWFSRFGHAMVAVFGCAKQGITTSVIFILHC